MITANEAIKTLAGVGISQKEDSFEAGVEIATIALFDNQLSDHSLFFLFATFEHDPVELMKGARSVAGENVSFFGCTTKGMVTKDFISYQGRMAGGAFITSAEPFYKSFFEPAINGREYEAGESVAKKIQLAE